MIQSLSPGGGGGRRRREEEDEPCYTTMQEIGRGPGLIFGAACCYLAGRQGAGPAPEPPEPDQGERGSWKVTSQPLEREREIPAGPESRTHLEQEEEEG